MKVLLKVIILYKDAGGVNQALQVVSGAVNNLGANFGTGLIQYVRDRIVDITGLGNTDSVQATATANSILQYAQLVKTESKSINILPDSPIIDNINGSNNNTTSNYIRPNNYVRINNLTLGLSYTSQGTGLVDSQNNDVFLISEIEIDNDTGIMTITPELTNIFNTLIN